MTMAQGRAECARRRGLERELLLRAATGSGSEALAAYEAWRARVDLDAAIDHETLALMPLLYGSLLALGLDDPLLGRLKGICRRTWFENQTLLHSAREAVACLARTGVECLLVGDLPIALTYYEGLFARGIKRVDAVVLPGQAQLAEGRLCAAGWVAGSPLRDEEVAYNHVKRLIGPAGQVLALHWHFLEAASSEAADRSFWAAGEAFTLDGMSARRLSPTGLLLHLLLGGGHPERELPGLWIADALVVIRRAAEQPDWSHMVGFAVANRLAVRLERKLQILSSYGAPVPEPTVRALREARTNLPESIDAMVLSSKGGRQKRIALWRCDVLADYLRSDRRAGLLNRTSDFSHFVRHRWGLRGRRELLHVLARNFRRKIAPGWP
jgi:hypothetical protein